MIEISFGVDTDEAVREMLQRRVARLDELVDANGGAHLTVELDDEGEIGVRVRVESWSDGEEATAEVWGDDLASTIHHAFDAVSARWVAARRSLTSSPQPDARQPDASAETAVATPRAWAA